MRKTNKLFTFMFALSILLGCLLPNSQKALAEGREAQLQAKIDQIVAGIPSSVATDVSKALYLHDYIVRNVAYEMVGDHQTAYGALLDGKAVCAGYADAYLRLLTAVGIQARTITGTADNGNGSPQPHAWTMLYLDGKCLFTDVTWDDPFINGVQDPNNISYDYFNLTLEQIQSDHFPDEESKKYLPASCNHTGYDFYAIHQGEGTGYGVFNNSITAKDAAKYFKYVGKIDGRDAFTCEFRFEGGDGNQWAHDNWVQIAQELGLSGQIGASFQSGSYAIKLTIKGTLISTVAVTSVTLTPDRITLRGIGESVQLTATVSPSNATDKSVTFTSSNTQVASVTPDGLVKAVGEGTATITVTTRDGGKTATCAVAVSIPAPPPPVETVPPTTEEPKPTEPKPTEPITEPTIPTEPVTQPTQPSEPTSGPTTPVSPTEPAFGTEPTEPSTNAPTNPKDPIPTEAPTESTVTMPSTGSNDPEQTTDPKPTQPSTQNGVDSDNSVVIIAATCGGALIMVLLILFLRKRR